MRALRGQTGFSLLEVLVVIAMLGLLAGVAALGISRYVRWSETESCRLERHVIVTALEAARLDNIRDEYPPVAGADGLDGLRATGFLEWQVTSGYWNYAAVPGEVGLTRLVRVDTAAVAESDCPPPPVATP